MFILRWLLVLALLVYCVVFLAAAGGVAADRLGLGLDSELWGAFVARAAEISWLETGLWAGAGIFLFIAMVRLLRRTQAFWAWLLGFACYSVRWGLLAGRSEENIVADAAAIRTVEDAQRTAITASNDYPLLALLVLLAIGLLILVVDAADKRWSRRA